MRGRTRERACQTQKLCCFSAQAADLYTIISWIVLHAQHLSQRHTKLPLSHTQTRPLYSHYCQADAVQPSLTCSFPLIHLLPSPLSFLLLFFVSPLSSTPPAFNPDGFDLGAAADTHRGQAQRVFGEPDGDWSTSPETRGGLKMVASERG